MTETMTAPGVIDHAKRMVASRTVMIRAETTGVVPMERVGRDGKPIVSSCEYNRFGKMMNVRHVRPLNFGTTGVQVINPADASDRELLSECKLWLADGTDARIAKFKIRIQEGGSAAGAPIPRYERYKPETLISRMTDEVNLIADDAEEVRGFLEACALYELQRVSPTTGKPAPRQKVLDAIEDLGATSGVEYGTDGVDEE